jgi:hypothetical protein
MNRSDRIENYVELNCHEITPTVEHVRQIAERKDPDFRLVSVHKDAGNYLSATFHIAGVIPRVLFQRTPLWNASDNYRFQAPNVGSGGHLMIYYP